MLDADKLEHFYFIQVVWIGVAYFSFHNLLLRRIDATRRLEFILDQQFGAINDINFTIILVIVTITNVEEGTVTIRFME